MALNEAEKAAVRNYMGYPAIKTGAAISLGVPDKTQYNFVLENNLQNLLEEHEPRVRRALLELECIEEQTTAARGNLEIFSVTGAVRLRGGDGIDDLWEEYVRWVNQLEDIFGTPANPLSSRLRRLGHGSPGVLEPH